MTDRLQGVYVAFDVDIREDDAKDIIAAISQIRHVLRVEPSVVDLSDFVARERVRRELTDKLWEILKR
jgi:hypothetical protein